MIDSDGLRQAHDDFLAVARGEGFGPPPPGEWDAERLIAHVGLADASIASAALAVLAGERPGYDNRASLDEWSLRRVVADCGGVGGLMEFAAASGRLLREVAAALPESALAVQLPILIISGDELIVDEPWSLDQLITGVARFHLPRHAEQLAGLR